MTVSTFKDSSASDKLHQKFVTLKSVRLSVFSIIFDVSVVEIALVNHSRPREAVDSYLKLLSTRYHNTGHHEKE